METNEVVSTENVQREVEPVQKPNFELLQSDTVLNGTFEPKKEEPKLEPTKEELKDPVEQEIVPDVVADKPEDKKEETISEEKEVDPLLEGVVELTPETVTENEPEEGSWVSIAKLEGLEVKEDSYEAFKEAITSPLKAQIEEVKSLTKEQLFAEYDPEHRAYMELADMGMKHEDIVAPLKNFEKFKNMDSVQLYREDLQLRLPNATPEFIDADVQKKIESGEIEHDATRIRLELDLMEKEILSEREQLINKHKANREVFLQQQRTLEMETMSKALNNMSDIMGTPLSADVKKSLSVEYSNGKYDQLLKDPEMKAKFIAFVKYGETAQKNLEVKNYNRGKLEMAKKLHNIPPVTTGGAGRLQQNTVEGNFEKLETDTHLKGS